MTRRVFQRGQRDRNEWLFKNLLDRYHIPFVLMPPSAGFDMLILTNPVQLWEIKSDEYKWSLTKAEQAQMRYCRTNGITYKVIETLQQAVDALEERETK